MSPSKPVTDLKGPRQVCVPLSGQTVFATIKSPAATSPQILLAAASMDSTAFFHDASPGAGAEIAGAVAMIAAARALRSVVDELDVPILMAIFAAEAWGRTGSRRFLSDPPKGLDKSQIKYAVGVDGISNTTSNIYVHVDEAMHPNDGLALQTQLVAGAGGELTAATTDRIPPNPVESVNLDPLLRGVPVAVLAGYDQQYGSQYYHSALDGPANAPKATACKLATALARSLHVLSSNSSATVSKLLADCAYVESLMYCLLQDFGCQLARDILGPDHDMTGPLSHYIFIRNDPASQNQWASP